MNSFAKELQEFLEKRKIKYQKNVPFGTLSYLKLGGVAAFAVYPENELDFCATLNYAFLKNIPIRVIGRMSNLLPPEGVFFGIVLSTSGLNRIAIKNDRVTAETGVFLPRLAKMLLSYGMSAFEELSGIPASVGGAVYMNAGAYGREISDILLSATVYDKKNGCLSVVDKPTLDFSYRKSALSQKELYLFSATFKCEIKTAKEVQEKTGEYAKRRRLSQPLAYPSLGSVFKKHGTVSAGYYIDTAGLKGFSVGDAAVSEKHANFFINRGAATREDYRRLIETVKERVYDFHGITLVEEIEYF